jgi:hypothetical protein
LAWNTNEEMPYSSLDGERLEMGDVGTASTHAAPHALPLVSEWLWGEVGVLLSRVPIQHSKPEHLRPRQSHGRMLRHH